MLSNLGLAERRAYLARMTGDKGNGFYDRSLSLGSVPVDLRVPRTRSGDFRPTLLPDRYERGYPEESQSVAKPARLQPLGQRGQDRSEESVALLKAN
jgi:transposase-like protein